MHPCAQELYDSYCHIDIRSLDDMSLFFDMVDNYAAGDKRRVGLKKLIAWLETITVVNKNTPG